MTSIFDVTNRMSAILGAWQQVHVQAFKYVVGQPSRDIVDAIRLRTFQSNIYNARFSYQTS